MTVPNDDKNKSVAELMKELEEKEALLRNAENAIREKDLIIAELKSEKTEETSQSLEHKYKTLTEISLDGIIVLQGMRIKYANLELFELLNVSSEEDLLGQNLDTFIAPESADVVFEIERSLKYMGDRPRKHEFIALRKDGTRFYAEMHLVIVAYMGEIETLGLIRDITKLKMTEIALRKAKDEAEAANRVKSEFLANISHEIRTPLNAVMAYVNLLGITDIDSTQREYIQAIELAGRDLLTLITDILDLSKIEAGAMEIQMHPVNIMMILNEIQRIYSIEAKEKGLEFILEKNKDLPAGLLLDQVRLRQVLLNLIGNAVKFTHEGFVKIYIDCEAVSGGMSKFDLIIKIGDSGIGIEEDQLERIFESFVQKDGQDTRKYGGTGLGLAISKRLVKMMNGEILVESNPGKGSVFTVKLDDVQVAVIQERRKRARFEQSSSYVFEKAKVLIVEDIEVNRHLIKTILRNSGLEFIEAENGKIAQTKAFESHPDIIIMDVRMPVMDGFEATRLLKAQKEFKDIPIIAVAASDTKDQREKAKEAGCADFLSKPVIPSVLLDTLAEYLPHTKTAVEEVTEEDSSALAKLNIENLTDDEKLALNTALEKLNDDFMDTWKELNVTMVLDEIQQFGENMEKFGREKGLCELEKWGTKITKFAKYFQIKELWESFPEFPSLINSLKNAVGK